MKKIVALVLAVMMLLTAAGSALGDVYSDAGFIKKIPMKPKYSDACAQNGEIVRLTYTTHAYALEAMATGEWAYCLDNQGGDKPAEIPAGVLPEAGTDIMVEKELYVYLPYGYSADKDYNVLYVMHGGGDNAAYWLTDDGMGKGTRPVLDNEFMRGECEDTIIVTPTFYSIPNDADPMTYAFASGVWPSYFWMELKNEIIPLVESTYSTYAHGDVSMENLIATRDHRGYCGLSMGSATSLNSIMMHSIDVISWIGSFSGSLTRADEMIAALNSDEFKDYPINFWYNGNGSADMAHDEHQVFFQTMVEKMPERFVDGETTCWVEFKGGSHAYNCWLPHLYNCLKIFFKK